MSRAALAVAGALILAGCPLPQPLPDYPSGSITPPRILVDELIGDGAVTLVPANCTTVSYRLAPRVVDPITNESIEARWFVNYDYRDLAYSKVQHSSVVMPNADTTNLTRDIPAWDFYPYVYLPPYGTPSGSYPYRSAGITRVVEVVVSNGFDPTFDDVIAPAANRAPKSGFQTQVYRWVFLTVDGLPCP